MRKLYIPKEFRPTNPYWTDMPIEGATYLGTVEGNELEWHYFRVFEATYRDNWIRGGEALKVLEDDLVVGKLRNWVHDIWGRMKALYTEPVGTYTIIADLMRLYNLNPDVAEVVLEAWINIELAEFHSFRVFGEVEEGKTSFTILWKIH
jgi:hypothetical protein